MLAKMFNGFRMRICLTALEIENSHIQTVVQFVRLID